MLGVMKVLCGERSRCYPAENGLMLGPLRLFGFGCFFFCSHHVVFDPPFGFAEHVVFLSVLQNIHKPW